MNANIDAWVNIVVALRAEARPILEHFQLKKIHQSPYPIFSDDDKLKLIISGVGKTASANATTYLHQWRNTGGTTAWLNVGIGGHRDLPVGTCVSASQITDDSTGRTWYLPSMFETSCATVLVKTVEQPVTTFLSEAVHEMEAAGFYSAISKFTKPELIRVLKIISDNNLAPVDTITRAKVIQLIGNNIREIEQTILDLGQLSYQFTHQLTHQGRKSI